MTKEEHLSYVEKNGKFLFDTHSGLFPEEDVKILEKWGHWLQGLCNGELVPFTPEQQTIISLSKELDACAVHDAGTIIAKASSNLQRVWLKYLFRKKFEKEKPESQRRPEWEDNPFFSREDYKKLHKKGYPHK